MLFDSHAHLTDRRFDNDREETIQRAFDSGVEYIMNPGADFESSVEAIELAESHERIFAAVGVHPHDAKTMDESMLTLLESMAKKKKVKAIGEIGLDFHYDNSPRDIQRYWFRAQIQMAKRVGKPIIIHDRDANQETFDILNEEEAFENGVLMHCYSGSAELAKEYIKRGAYLSIAGPITFKNARKTVEVVEAVDLNWLMIETDCPYLTPVPYRGKRNESAYVKYVAERIAEIRGITVEEVAQATLNNAKRFFNIEI